MRWHTGNSLTYTMYLKSMYVLLNQLHTWCIPEKITRDVEQHVVHKRIMYFIVIYYLSSSYRTHFIFSQPLVQCFKEKNLLDP